MKLILAGLALEIVIPLKVAMGGVAPALPTTCIVTVNTTTFPKGGQVTATITITGKFKQPTGLDYATVTTSPMSVVFTPTSTAAFRFVGDGTSLDGKKFTCESPLVQMLPPPIPTCTISLSDTQVLPSTAVKVTFSGANTNGKGTLNYNDGTAQSLTVSTPYTLNYLPTIPSTINFSGNVQSADGVKASCTATLEVFPPPKCALTGVLVGNAETLTWNLSGALSASLMQNGVSIKTTASAGATPTTSSLPMTLLPGTHSFIMNVMGYVGSSYTCGPVNVVVPPPPTTCTVSVDKTSFPKGGQVKATMTITGAFIQPTAVDSAKVTVSPTTATFTPTSSTAFSFIGTGTAPNGSLFTCNSPLVQMLPTATPTPTPTVTPTPTPTPTPVAYCPKQPNPNSKFNVSFADGNPSYPFLSFDARVPVKLSCGKRSSPTADLNCCFYTMYITYEPVIGQRPHSVELHMPYGDDVTYQLTQIKDALYGMTKDHFTFDFDKMALYDLKSLVEYDFMPGNLKSHVPSTLTEKTLALKKVKEFLPNGQPSSLMAYVNYDSNFPNNPAAITSFGVGPAGKGTSSFTVVQTPAEISITGNNYQNLSYLRTVKASGGSGYRINTNNWMSFFPYDSDKIYYYVDFAPGAVNAYGTQVNVTTAGPSSVKAVILAAPNGYPNLVSADLRFTQISKTSNPYELKTTDSYNIDWTERINKAGRELASSSTAAAVSRTSTYLHGPSQNLLSFQQTVVKRQTSCTYGYLSNGSPELMQCKDNFGPPINISVQGRGTLGYLPTKIIKTVNGKVTSSTQVDGTTTNGPFEFALNGSATPGYAFPSTTFTVSGQRHSLITGAASNSDDFDGAGFLTAASESYGSQLQSNYLAPDLSGGFSSNVVVGNKQVSAFSQTWLPQPDGSGTGTDSDSKGSCSNSVSATAAASNCTSVVGPSASSFKNANVQAPSSSSSSTIGVASESEVITGVVDFGPGSSKKTVKDGKNSVTVDDTLTH